MSRQHIGRPARALLLAILVPASVGAVTVTTWRNSDNPLDVNADGQVTAQDALVLVQEVNANGSHALTVGCNCGSKVLPSPEPHRRHSWTWTVTAGSPPPTWRWWSIT